MNKVSVFSSENFDSFDVERLIECVNELGLSVVQIENGEAYEFVISTNKLTDDELCDFMRIYYENEEMSNESILEMVVKSEE